MKHGAKRLRACFSKGSFCWLAHDARLVSSVAIRPSRRKRKILQKRFLKVWPKDLEETEDFNRWKILPAAVMNHMCIGSVYAWSVLNQPMTRMHGVVAPASTDWTLPDISLTFSLVMGGFAFGALVSKTLDRLGPRVCSMIGASCLGSGFLISSYALQSHNLYIMYAGGIVWGLANGWAYVPPAATAVRWFPERKGFASGAVMAGFGGGAMIASPVFSGLLKHFEKRPTFLGPEGSLPLQFEDGAQYAEVNGSLQEVVIATAKDVANTDFETGVYLVGSGSTGATETLMCMGIGYATIMFGTSLVYRLPPQGYGSNLSQAKDAQITKHNVPLQTAVKTPAFHLCWLGFGTSVAGAFGIISCGATILGETFGKSMPDTVTPTYIIGFVSAMSIANMSGRLIWTNVSDIIAKATGGDPFWGRRKTFTMMWILSPALYCLCVHSIHAEPNVVSLSLFCVSVLGIMSNFGGTPALRPAIIGDLFGTKYLTENTATQLFATLPAAVVGPRLASVLRESSIKDACYDLSSKISDNDFLHAFGSPKDQLDLLVSKNTVTVNRLLDLCPDGTIDPR